MGLKKWSPGGTVAREPTTTGVALKQLKKAINGEDTVNTSVAYNSRSPGVHS